MLRPKGRLIRVNITIDENLLARFDGVLAEYDLNRSQAISQLVEEYMKEQTIGSD